jgi:hypothetical protein
MVMSVPQMGRLLTVAIVDTSNSKKTAKKQKTEAMKNRRVNGSHEALIVLSSDNVAGMESVRPTGHGLCHWLSPTTLKPVNNHPISKKN